MVLCSTAAMSMDRRSFLTSTAVAVVGAFVASISSIVSAATSLEPFQWQNNELTFTFDVKAGNGGKSAGFSWTFLERTDPTSYVLVVALIGVATLLASYLPARRATHVDPLVALHSDGGLGAPSQAIGGPVFAFAAGRLGALARTKLYDLLESPGQATQCLEHGGANVTAYVTKPGPSRPRSE